MSHLSEMRSMFFFLVFLAALAKDKKKDLSYLSHSPVQSNYLDEPTIEEKSTLPHYGRRYRYKEGTLQLSIP